MALEIKIREKDEKERFPALYSSENRETIILATGFVGDTNVEGTVLHPKSAFGEYSETWNTKKYSRMSVGSELTFKFIQE